jgi:hypothetical protein
MEIWAGSDLVLRAVEINQLTRETGDERDDQRAERRGDETPGPYPKPARSTRPGPRGSVSVVRRLIVHDRAPPYLIPADHAARPGIADIAFWRKTPRFAVKLPDSPAALSLVNPYPDLEESWYQDEREWGWTLDLLEVVPDLRSAVEIAERFHPLTGPMSDAPDREHKRGGSREFVDVDLEYYARKLSEEKYAIAKAIYEQLEQAVSDRGLPWTPVFKRG